MSKPITDKERAKILGVSLDQFYVLAGDLDAEDYLQDYLKEEKSIAKDYGERDELEEMMGESRGLPGTTDLYNDTNIQIYWDKAPSSEEEHALFYGYHIHSKDNPYGLHTHIPGGKLGGGHKHGPQMPLGEHTHEVDLQALESTGLEGGKTGRGPIWVDGAHEHERLAPDGGHGHSPQTFG